MTTISISASTPASTPRADDGFTLLEVMLATTISVLALGALTTAFLVGISTTETTTQRTAASHDAQLLSSYLPGDVLSVAPTGVNADPAAPTGCNDTLPAGEDGSGSRNWLRLQWSQDIAGAVTNYSASYRTRPSADGWVLVRYFCSGTTLANETPTETIVAHELADPSEPATAPSIECSVGGVDVTCGSGVDRVSVELTTSSAFTFSVAGARRTPTSVPVVPSVVPDHFLLTVPATATAGTPFAVTVTAKDASNATLTGYTGTVRFSTAATMATLPSDTTFTSSDNGVRTISGVTLKKAGSTVLSVNDTFTTSATGTGTVAVGAAAPSALAWTSSTPSCATSPITVGNKGKFTSNVGLLDAYGNTAANGTGGAVTINIAKTGSSGGSLAPTSLTIATSASETGASFTAELPAGANKTFTVTAEAAGQTWSAVTCVMNT